MGVILERNIEMYCEKDSAKEQARIRLMIVCLGIIGLLSFSVAILKKHNDNYTIDSVVVTRGDTLWNIASEYCPDYIDKRDYIDFIQLDNKCDVNIRPGDVLNIRVYGE